VSDAREYLMYILVPLSMCAVHHHRERVGHVNIEREIIARRCSCAVGRLPGPASHEIEFAPRWIGEYFASITTTAELKCSLSALNRHSLSALEKSLSFVNLAQIDHTE